MASEKVVNFDCSDILSTLDALILCSEKDHENGNTILVEFKAGGHRVQVECCENIALNEFLMDFIEEVKSHYGVNTNEL